MPDQWQPRIPDWLRERVIGITGPCSCHEAYTSRGLIAPDCVYHECAQDIVELCEDITNGKLEEPYFDDFGFR